VDWTACIALTADSTAVAPTITSAASTASIRTTRATFIILCSWLVVCNNHIMLRSDLDVHDYFQIMYIEIIRFTYCRFEYECEYRVRHHESMTRTRSSLRVDHETLLLSRLSRTVSCTYDLMCKSRRILSSQSPML
jgi:hypothetical protein